MDLPVMSFNLARPGVAPPLHPTQSLAALETCIDALYKCILDYIRLD